MIRTVCVADSASVQLPGELRLPVSVGLTSDDSFVVAFGRCLDVFGAMERDRLVDEQRE